MEGTPVESRATMVIDVTIVCFLLHICIVLFYDIPCFQLEVEIPSIYLAKVFTRNSHIPHIL